MEPDHLIVETALEGLARRLRTLGYDVASAGSLPLAELLACARRQDRIAVTTSARRPRRWADVRVVMVDPADPKAAVRAIDRSYVPAGPAFSRCPRCNEPLEELPCDRGRGHVPVDVLERAAALRHCVGCGRWFWWGSHAERMREWFTAALGRDVGGDWIRPASS